MVATAVASGQGSVSLWAGGDLHTLSRKQVLLDLHGRVTAIDFSPDGSQLLVATTDSNVESRSTTTGQLVFKFGLPYTGHDVISLRFSPLESQVVSVDQGIAIIVTDIGTFINANSASSVSFHPSMVAELIIDDNLRALMCARTLFRRLRLQTADH